MLHAFCGLSLHLRYSSSMSRMARRKNVRPLLSALCGERPACGTQPGDLRVTKKLGGADLIGTFLRSPRASKIAFRHELKHMRSVFVDMSCSFAHKVKSPYEDFLRICPASEIL